MLLAAAMLTTSTTAWAGPVIHVEGQGQAVRLGDTSADVGTGFGARVGWGLSLVAVRIAPEVGMTVWTKNEALFVPELGARAAFGKLLEPGVYAHVLFPLRDGMGPGWDGGLSLDLTAIPKIDVGAQAGLMSLGGAPSLTVGAHVGLKL